MREKVAFRPDEGICFEVRIMVCFQLISVPHPPLTWSPLSQLCEGFECFGFLIWYFSFSMREKVADEAG